PGLGDGWVSNRVPGCPAVVAENPAGSVMLTLRVSVLPIPARGVSPSARSRPPDAAAGNRPAPGPAAPLRSPPPLRSAAPPAPPPQPPPPGQRTPAPATPPPASRATAVRPADIAASRLLHATASPSVPPQPIADPHPRPGRLFPAPLPGAFSNAPPPAIIP